MGGFFNALFCLRLVAATTPQQRRACQRLFAILDQTRDQILAEAKLSPTAVAPADTKAATDFFQDVEKGRSSKGAPPRSSQPGNSR